MTDSCMDGWTDGQMNRWNNGQADARKNASKNELNTWKQVHSDKNASKLDSWDILGQMESFFEDFLALFSQSFPKNFAENLFIEKIMFWMDQRTDRWTNGQTDGPTDQQTDGLTNKTL